MFIRKAMMGILSNIILLVSNHFCRKSLRGRMLNAGVLIKIIFSSEYRSGYLILSNTFVGHDSFEIILEQLSCLIMRPKKILKSVVYSSVKDLYIRIGSGMPQFSLTGSYRKTRMT